MSLSRSMMVLHVEQELVTRLNVMIVQYLLLLSEKTPRNDVVFGHMACGCASKCKSPGNSMSF